ncbi:DUF5696 domain-containing protein [Paenibacillus lignilyticus]|uniref:Uncharacterized protein n=1 Tax=Paenibacillus lignilyticus TaxID=1172615 RepID=A0ABS5C6H0_9BACL|nr:hypothetical protein [Paenibacillus lignilyticus]
MINRKHVVIAALCGCLAAGTAIINYADGANANVGSITGEATVGSTAAGRGKSSNGEVSVASLNPASDTAVRTINTPEELNALNQMEQVSETDALALFINKETAEIAVKDKRDGYVWFSNPIGHQKDTLASPLYQSELSSQLLLTYYNEKGQVYRFNSHDDSVEKKQFEISAAKNGVRIVYRFGKASGGTENIPAVISEERFQKLILDKLPDDDARKQVTYKFRLNPEKQVYEIRNLQDNVKQELAGYLTQAGYSKEDAAQDNQENGAEAAASDEQAAFTIPVEYALDADQFVVSIAAKDVRYSPEFPLASVQVLKHFGAATDKKQGYIFVPDGSGALIQLNNKKLSAEPFNMPVYGEDGTFDVKERVVTSSPVRLPVFGLKQNDHAVLGIIEDGDALSSVLADISGRHDSYNTVNSEFQFVAMDYYTLSSGTKTSSVPMFQQQPYQGDLRVRYSFLSGSAADYVGMAGAYRNYLIDKHKLKKLDEQANAPFILEVEGAFRKKKSFLGIPYSATESLTTYDEAGSMLKLLKTQGIDTIALRYVGWFNDGIRHSSPKDVELEGALGGKKGLQRLIDFTKQNGIGLYPDVAFLEKYKGAKDSADLLDRRSAAVYNYNPVMYVQDGDSFSHYKLSPNKLPSTVDAFMDDYAKFGISGLSLRDMGNEVNSDFNPQASVDRQAARNTILHETDKLKQQNGRLMISGGNAYTLPYADVVVNAPTSSNRLNITDEDVMFYQIALHGYVDLAGAPFNMDAYQNPRASMLKALETGSNIYYAWYYNEASVVKDTAYNDLYALHYADWLDEAAKLYNEANPILKQVRNQVITGHRNLADRVVETTFENGMTIIVNYNQTAVQVNGMEIGAESYRVGGE